MFSFKPNIDLNKRFTSLLFHRKAICILSLNFFFFYDLTLKYYNIKYCKFCLKKTLQYVILILQINHKNLQLYHFMKMLQLNLIVIKLFNFANFVQIMLLIFLFSFFQNTCKFLYKLGNHNNYENFATFHEKVKKGHNFIQVYHEIIQQCHILM